MKEAADAVSDLSKQVQSNTDTSTGNFQAITENAELIDGLLKEANKKINANGEAITKAKEGLSANLGHELSHQKELLDAKISESGNAATEAAGMLQGNIEDAKKEASDAVAAAKKEATDALATATAAAATARSTLGSDLEGKIDAAKKAAAGDVAAAKQAA